MEKIIAKENLADFIVKMWDANIAVDLKPSEGYLILWSAALKKHTYIRVGYATYDDIVSKVLDEMKEE